MIVKVLGEKWKIKEVDGKDDVLQGGAGMCYLLNREIYIANDLAPRGKRLVYRHEIIHAFMAESGLLAYATEMTEEIWVDWYAKMYPMLTKVYLKLGVNDD